MHNIVASTFQFPSSIPRVPFSSLFSIAHKNLVTIVTFLVVFILVCVLITFIYTIIIIKVCQM